MLTFKQFVQDLETIEEARNKDLAHMSNAAIDRLMRLKTSDGQPLRPDAHAEMAYRNKKRITKHEPKQGGKL